MWVIVYLSNKAKYVCIVQFCWINIIHCKNNLIIERSCTKISIIMRVNLRQIHSSLTLNRRNFRIFWVFHRLQNCKNHEKDYGYQNKCWLRPTIYTKNILTNTITTPDIFQVILKSKDHSIFFNYNLYIYLNVCLWSRLVILK